jgi:hypothetical protein
MDEVALEQKFLPSFSGFAVCIHSTIVPYASVTAHERDVR